MNSNTVRGKNSSAIKIARVKNSKAGLVKVLSIEMIGFGLSLLLLKIMKPLIIIVIFGLLISLVKRFSSFACLYDIVRRIFAEYRGPAYLGLAVIALLCPLFFLSNPYLILTITLALIYVILALGLNFTVGFVGILDFGYSSFYAIGAYTSALLALRFGLPFWIVLPLAASVAALISIIIGLPALRLKLHYLAAMTLAFGILIYILCNNLTQLTGGPDGLVSIPAPKIIGFSFSDDHNIWGVQLPFQLSYYYLIAFFAFLALFVSLRLNNSKLGRAWSAIKDDEVAAKCCGIKVNRIKLIAFFVSAFFAGIAGSLYAHFIHYINPQNFTFMQSMTVLMMVILGGRGNVGGVVLAAIILSMLPEGLREFESWRMVAYGILLATFMIYRRQGLFPRSIKARHFQAELAIRVQNENTK